MKTIPPNIAGPNKGILIHIGFVERSDYTQTKQYSVINETNCQEKFSVADSSRKFLHISY